MKKTISLLLALLLVTSCFAFRAPDANALGAVWVKEFYKENPKDTSEKKFSSKRFSAKKSDEGFSYDNCVEKKYWKKRSKNDKLSSPFQP